MKLATLCMFLGIITCFATKTYSQQTFFTLDVQNEQVKTVFEEIEKNSEFIIFYLDKSVNLKRKVSVSVENEPVEEILDQIFDGTNNNYSIDGRQITIYRNNTRPAPGPQQVQEKEVKGIVIDDFDEPVIGANVMVKGTTNGTITDFNGEFVLTGVPEDAVIVISYIGYFTQEMSVANQTVFNIKLTEDTQQLDAVVVIGYGTVRKGDITSSVGSVKEENFLKGAVKDAGQLIQGQVAGLIITNSSGDPTSKTAVSLRGNTTILGASTNPLILIDGVPGDFNTVAPEDIESVDVLKDGSAAAIYGSRGTNGVILITTKKAKGNNINTVEYHGYISTATIAKNWKCLQPPITGPRLLPVNGVPETIGAVLPIGWMQ
ncbi:MAG: TonB-dependent receptor plug domain-containing protein [Tannerellaceae bacterium]|nr:TonB-dependent receptor plug domain-containing protein [Tannerellaceae bacterium]